MPGVDPKVSVHRLYMDPHYKSVKAKEEDLLGGKGRGHPGGGVQTANGKCHSGALISDVDCDPLPNIDRLVDSSAGYKVVNYMDAFHGYHKIFMAKEDVEKTAFITDHNMEIYVDEILIKSREADDHEANLRESFSNLRMYKLRLNPEKGVFGVTSGKFLRYMISQRRMEPMLETLSYE
ncbi:hypothetical protein LIER_36713 [Lithospermum erythrorhizon]|uniref:Reverse transcriptase domain-containing protein n=1 Tax=Lithospermum erythrorhizon TaxID=34254 RepID=A0AAV3PBS0_LITER